MILGLMIIIYASVYTMIYRCDRNSDKLKILDLKENSMDYRILAKDYEISMKEQVLPLLDSLQTTGVIKNGAHTVSYNMYLLDSPKANIVISHGFIERKEKYKEAIYYFLNMGYQVFILDHYSHGASGRATADSSIIHITSYQDLASDLHAFVKSTVVKNSKGKKTILFGHSMGGAIATLMVETYPDIIDGLILNAPMFKIKNPIPEFAGEPVTKLMTAFGKGDEYAIGYRAYDPGTDSVYNPKMIATYCEKRAQYWHYQHLNLTQHPTFGASWCAGANFIDLTHEILRKGNVEKIKQPVLMFQAERDAFVDPKGQYEFANRIKNIEYYLVRNAGHEIYIEEDQIIVPYFKKVNEFIERVIKL